VNEQAAVSMSNVAMILILLGILSPVVVTLKKEKTATNVTV